MLKNLNIYVPQNQYTDFTIAIESAEILLGKYKDRVMVQIDNFKPVIVKLSLFKNLDKLNEIKSKNFKTITFLPLSLEPKGTTFNALK